jgi:ABC-2 type transport system ATP-binding protein
MSQFNGVGERPAILVEDLTKSFGEVHALRGTDLSVPRGTVLGVLGPNGAGKPVTGL